MGDDAILRLAFGGLHPDRVRDLLDRYRTSAAILRAIESGKVDVTEDVAAAIRVPASQRRAQLTDAGIRFMLRDDYPPYLRDQPACPPFLFIRGELPAQLGVAVVGTRRCTAYGRRVAHSYGRAVAAAGIPLISGLARGIDAAAHQGTVARGGIGVAVMGCGLERVYPREHGSLARALLTHGGAIVSEYPPGAPPLPWRFPPRNRIITVLAAAVVVVEANATGGALITARHALDLGVEVLATPGDITRRASAGTNNLIRDGAIPVFDADDLLEALWLMAAFPTPSRPPPAAEPDDTDPDGLLDHISMSGTSQDELRHATDTTAATLQENLRRLELSGCIVREGDLILRVSPRLGPGLRHP